MPTPHCLGNPLVYTVFEVILDELVCTRPTAHQVTFGSAPSCTFWCSSRDWP